MAHFSAIINSSQDAIIGKTLDGIVTSWNPGAERLYGYTAAEMIGQPISNLTPLDRSDEIKSHLLRLGYGGSVEQYDTVRRRKDGTLVDVSLTLSPIKNHEGKIIGASAIAHEITDRKRADELLRANEERLTNIINNAAEAFTPCPWMVYLPSFLRSGLAYSGMVFRRSRGRGSLHSSIPKTYQYARMP